MITAKVLNKNLSKSVYLYFLDKFSDLAKCIYLLKKQGFFKVYFQVIEF